MNISSPVVIFISHVVPYPPAAGNEIRILKLIGWLKKEGYRIIFLLKADELEASIRKSLEEIVDAVHLMSDDIPDESDFLGSGYRRSVSFIDWAFDFFLKSRLADIIMPRQKHYKLRSDAIKKSLAPDRLIQVTRHLCHKYSPRVVIAEYIFTTPCLDVIPPGVLKIVDTHDMFSRKKEKVLSFGIEDYLHCSRREERNYLLKSDVIIAIQSDEAGMFKRLVPEREVITVGIDYEVVNTVDNSSVIPGRILIVGSDNAPNLQGLNEFYKHSWARIRNRNSLAELRIVGKIGHNFNAKDERVQIQGWVEDLDREYAEASVVINPTLAGTGLKIKSVEALCRAKPLIASPNSVEGILFDAEPPFVVCKNWRDFSDAVILLLESEEKRVEFQNRALDCSKKNFSSEKVYHPLAERLRQSLESSPL